MNDERITRIIRQLSDAASAVITARNLMGGFNTDIDDVLSEIKVADSILNGVWVDLQEGVTRLDLALISGAIAIVGIVLLVLVTL